MLHCTYKFAVTVSVFLMVACIVTGWLSFNINLLGSSLNYVTKEGKVPITCIKLKVC